MITENENPPLAQTTADTFHVLVVDDDEKTRQYLCRQVELDYPNKGKG